MTKSKNLKRAVRERMQKTGEAYTSARAALVKKQPPRADWPELAGHSDATVSDKTGKTWAEWVRLLDESGASSKSHADIAKLVLARHPEIGGWWAQGVTVGYERIRGLRDKGQRRGDKTFEIGKSRTFAVPVAVLYRAFAAKAQRARWLPEALTVRTSRVDQSMRITWEADGTSLHVYFTDKGEAKSSVTVQHVGHATKEAAEASRAFWHERLTALGEVLKAAAARAKKRG